MSGRFVSLAHGAVALCLVLAASACGADGDDAAPSQLIGGGPSFGQPCGPEGQCEVGLVCLNGDWAPRPWCGQVCDKAGDYCDTATTGGVSTLCVELPEDFQGQERRFCAPICDNVNQCSAISSDWDKCGQPTWKNKVLYNDLPTRVCMAPGAQGQVVVDPVVCDWQDKLTAPKYVGAIQVCKAYCTFLKTCQYWDTGKEKIDCCHWRCIQEMTPGGAVDDAVEDEKKCYINAFTNAQGTPKVCTLHEQQCQPLPDPHAP